MVTNLEHIPVDQMTRDVLLMLLFTGQRSGEVRGMRISEIDVAEKLWRLPAWRTKNGRSNLVPLMPRALEVIARSIMRYEYKRGESDLLFPTKPRSKAFGNHPKEMERTVPSAALSRNIEVLGFADAPFTPHDLRRTVSTNLAEPGVLPHIIERLANRKGGEVSQIAEVYIRAEMLSQIRAAIDLWSGILDCAVDDVTRH